MSIPHSLPQPIGGGRQHLLADDDNDGVSIPIPAGSSLSHPYAGALGSTPTGGGYGGRLSGATDYEGSSRSFVPGSSFSGGSFIAGHSAFGRQSTPHARQHVRTSLEHASSLPRQTSGIHLGLEPGLSSSHEHSHLQQQQPQQPALITPESTPQHPAAVVAFAVPADASGGLAADASSAAVAAGLQDGQVAGAPPPPSAVAAGSPGKRRGGLSTLRNDVLYGIINAVVGIPTMISFAAIVFQDPTYKPLLGQLARISFFSAAVHQLVFTLFSSLPFAVGQPQDVGLIFLSSMATGIAEIGREVQLDTAVVVGTALLTLTIATAVVGAMTMLVAKFKLATLVQYVPLPVVGGYLGYVGYFCLAAGLGLGCNTTINTFSSWANLMQHDALIKFIPTFAAALVLWLSMTKARSPWALPVTLAAVPAAFHIYLLASGTSLEQAQDAGWVLKPQGRASEQFWELYGLFNIHDWQLDGIYLTALLRQIPKMLGLFFVVTFGSCLDVAAIQADVPYPINFNSELGTVGLSNIIVGLAGAGYTGSYIFSQTIFSMRAGVAGFAHGAVIFGLEAAIFFLPFSVVQYLPNFFFGALLMVFGIEIAGDWLARSYAKVTRAEYILLLATFVAIMELELEMGVAAGVLMCIVYFTVTYARANMAAFTVLPSRSAAVRSYTESHILEALSGHIATVAASGFMFFGSSVLMSDKVIQLAEDMVAAAAAAGTAVLALDQQQQQQQTVGAHALTKAHSKGHARAAVVAVHPSGLGLGDSVVVHNVTATGAAETALAATPGKTDENELWLSNLALIGQQPQAADGGASLHIDSQRLALLQKQAPCHILLDFRQVLGIDATAAQTLGSLAMVLRRTGVELVLTRVTNPGIKRLLAAHGIIASHDTGSSHAAGLPEHQQPLLEALEADDDDGYCRVFDTLNEGAKYAEDRLLAMAHAAGLLQDSLTGLSVLQFFTMHCSQALMTSGVDAAAIAAEVEKLGVLREVPAGQRLFGFGDMPGSFYLILKGEVEIHVMALAAPPSSFRPLPAQLDVFEIERSFSSGQGAVVGITDFVLQRLRSFQADTTSDCVLLEIDRQALETMAREMPAVATVLQAILLRDACLSEVYAYEVLERSSRA